jgi:hypothetical protein
MPVAAIAAGTSIAGGIAQSNAANSAAKAQQQASQANISNNNEILGNVAADVNPTIGFGNQAGSELAGLLGTGGNAAASQNAFKNYLGSTNYQFQLGQGLQGVGYLNAPNLYSGATGKALNNYAQGMAGNALYGYEGLLQNQQGLGLQGSSIYANAGTNIAAQNAQARNLAAGAQGTADLYGANAINSALGGVSNAFGSSSFNNAFNGLFGGGSPALNGGVSSASGFPSASAIPFDMPQGLSSAISFLG